MNNLIFAKYIAVKYVKQQYYVHIIKGGMFMLVIIGILIVLWFLGLLGNIGGGLIHILLVIALIVFIYNMITGRRGI